MIVALDGPAGAGKSTLARRLAERLGFQLIETGSLYRSVALAARRAGVAWDDTKRLAELADAIDVGFAVVDGRNRVRLNGEDVTDALRTPEVSDGASRVSAVPEVRAALLELQRRIGRACDTVMEGRDIGTVVFPASEVKFFLTASVDERARRRLAEETAGGTARDLETVRAEIVERDRRDCERDVAPLRPADDARILDTTGREVEELLDELVRAIEGARS